MKANPEVETEGAGQVSDRAPLVEKQEPRSPNEEYLASLWVEIIGLEPDQVQLTRTFVEVGGNSLTLNVILNRIEADTGAALAAELFFDENRSSLSALARELDLLRAGEASSSETAHT
jgi:Phosphopantetheine attachment site